MNLITTCSSTLYVIMYILSNYIYQVYSLPGYGEFYCVEGSTDC